MFKSVLTFVKYASLMWLFDRVKTRDIGVELSQTVPLNAAGDVTVRWGFAERKIIFEVKTLAFGWTGIGLSESGAMKNSDIVVMWTANDEHCLLDMHGIANGPPKSDETKNYKMVSIIVNNGIAIFTFERYLKTCDDQDIEIDDRTFHVIWARGEQIPDRKVLTEDYYHGNQNRGVKALKLMNPIPPGIIEIGGSYSIYEIRVNDLQLPSKTTYYYCKIFRLQFAGQKHHIIQYEPIITQGNENRIYHMTASLCTFPGKNDFFDTGAECYSEIRPYELGCTAVPMNYAIGGSKFTFPPLVGYPIGEDFEYMLMEIHYNNPEATEFTDSSGFRMYYTPELRPLDAGVIVAGYPTILTMAIPPNSSHFQVHGHCLQKCLAKAFDASPVREITIFAGSLHARNMGKRLFVRHFRNGTEMQPLLRENSYDAKRQETKYSAHRVEVRYGDSLVVECEYDTEERKDITFGGLSVDEETCTVYISYYPRIDLPVCMSIHTRESFFEMFKASSIDQMKLNAEKMIWNQTTTSEFNKAFLDAPINPVCQKRQGLYMNFTEEFLPPKTPVNYEEQVATCGSARPRWSYLLFIPIYATWPHFCRTR